MPVKRCHHKQEYKMSNSATRDGAAIGRERWSWRFDFLATNIGFVASFQNLWRFPYLVYINGGAVFLIPYLLCAMFLAIPLLFLEMAIGQYSSLGSIKAWKICPLFQGIGVANNVVIGWHNIYYNVILAWTLYYLYSSCIGGELPWASCNHEWNTKTCLNSHSEWVCINGTYVATHKGDIPEVDESELSLSWMSNRDWPYEPNSDSSCFEYPDTTIPAQEFWSNKVLKNSESSGIHDPGAIVWHLALTLFLAWTLVYFLLWKGVKWSGKVAYFTAPFIHIVLFVFVIRGATLPGAMDGLLYYLRPDVRHLRYAQVWVNAGTEALYAFSVGLGAFTALGSHNKFHYNFYRDSMIVCYLNLMTSIYGGIIVFSFIGFVSYSEFASVGSTVYAGTGLHFVVFPRAFAAMSGSRAWAVLFFLVVLMIMLNRQVVTMQAFTTSVLDSFPKRLRKGYYKELFVLGVCFFNFLIGLSMVTEGGSYVLTLLDVYSSSPFVLVWICFFESIAIGWFYGVRRFSSDIADMLQWRQIEWYIICWPATVPLLSFLVWIGSIFDWFPLNGVNDSLYPRWADGLGFLITISAMACIPIGMIYAFVYQLIEGSGPFLTRMKTLVQPSIVPVRDEEPLPSGVEMTHLMQMSL